MSCNSSTYLIIIKISEIIDVPFFYYINSYRKFWALSWELVRLSTQGDFGIPARTLADGQFPTPVAFVKRIALPIKGVA
jgi:hypothetical protein